MQPSPRSSFRTSPSVQKIFFHLQSISTPTPTLRQPLICFLFCLFKNFHENGIMADTVFVSGVFFIYVLRFIHVVARICSCFLSSNSNCWMAVSDYGHLECFQFLSIMKNAASSEHSSLNSCVNICFHFSWVLRTRVAGS